MLGYNMHYYRSATTEITFWYLGTLEDNESVKIPKFTMITDDSGENTFTLLQSVEIQKASTPFIGDAIQGTIHDYEVNGVTDITLDNLDSEYRLFFTESKIAENGIFITNKGNGNDFNTDEWKKVDNLESSTLNSKNI